VAVGEEVAGLELVLLALPPFAPCPRAAPGLAKPVVEALVLLLLGEAEAASRGVSRPEALARDARAEEAV
jgi:hypothetical protein